MGISFIKTKKRRILTVIILFVGILLVILFNTSPYYVVATHDKWQAQETDCEITLKRHYKAKRSHYYYYSGIENFEDNITGKIVINETEYHFGIQIQPKFDRFNFGNTDFNTDSSKLYDEEPYWRVHGYIDVSPIDTITADSFKIAVIDNIGDVFPDNIKELTFVHVDK